MPTPTELTALLLAGSISVGDYDHKGQCPEVKDMAHELLMTIHEAKHRDVYIQQIPLINPLP